MTKEDYSLAAVAPTVSAILGAPSPSAAVTPPIPEMQAELSVCDRVAVLVPDALGLSIWRRWERRMPFLASLHASRHLVLRSVAPPVTPVNFATLVTGAPPDVHCVRAKHDTIRCHSLFDVVRASGWASAGVGQPGYTGGEFLARHADLCGRAATNADDAVAAMVIRLSREYSPRFIVAQLGEPDTVFHRLGPYSLAVGPVIRATDQRLRYLVSELTGLAYAVIIAADHGQHDIGEPGEGGLRGGHDGSRWDEDSLVPCTWTH